ncbi:hypothetical protein CP532_4886 [Ophiocordyceps camponoti-leonardi (nom. inval.)]|nr:hypothetical protein CP532_4886 [Ophiocordyceps camponoti-leonardi (nom. inval.)]
MSFLRLNPHDSSGLPLSALLTLFLLLIHRAVWLISTTPTRVSPYNFRRRLVPNSAIAIGCFLISGSCHIDMLAEASLTVQIFS